MFDVGARKPERITSTPFVENNIRVSPDSRWVAYQANEAGVGRPDEIYLHSIADRRRRIQVSTVGGYVPRWRRDGRELYYLAPDRTLMAVAVDLAGSQPRIGAPWALFRTLVTRAGGSRALRGRRRRPLSRQHPRGKPAGRQHYRAAELARASPLAFPRCSCSASSVLRKASSPHGISCA